MAMVGLLDPEARLGRRGPAPPTAYSAHILAARAFTPEETRLLCEPARRLSMTRTANAAGLERFSLSGRIVLVTGSTRGLGLAIAGGMAAAGAVVGINGRDTERVREI